MDDFSITTKLTTKDYSKVMFFGLYRKPVFIFLTICGICMLGTSILDHFKIIDFYPDTPYLEIFGGLFLLLLPTLIVMIAVRQFLSNPGFQNEIKYTFSEGGVKRVQGLTFKGEFLWRRTSLSATGNKQFFEFCTTAKKWEILLTKQN